MPMNPLQKASQIDEMIRSSDLCLIYFSGSSGPICEPLRRKVETLLVSFPSIKSGFLDAEEHPEVVGPYQIFTVPLFLFFVQGKETLREGKYVDIRELADKISRYYDLFSDNREIGGRR